jgi:competence protein ComEC
VLHPPPEGVPGNDNARSIVIDLEARGRRLLLTGDLEGTGLDRLLVRPKTRYDVILAPHHGSARSNPPGTV